MCGLETDLRIESEERQNNKVRSFECDIIEGCLRPCTLRLIENKTIAQFHSLAGKLYLLTNERHLSSKDL